MEFTVISMPYQEAKNKETKTKKKQLLERLKKKLESKEMKYKLLGNYQRYMFLQVIS